MSHSYAAERSPAQHASFTISDRQEGFSFRTLMGSRHTLSLILIKQIYRCNPKLSFHVTQTLIHYSDLMNKGTLTAMRFMIWLNGKKKIIGGVQISVFEIQGIGEPS